MKFKFNKKMVSTIVILIFGIAITVAALPAKNMELENKTSSEIATETVSATEMILDTENTETSNVDKNSSDFSKDKATVVDDKDKSGDMKNSDKSSTTTKETGKSLKDTKSSSETTDNNNDSDNDNSGMSNNNEQKSDNGVIELPIIPVD